MQSNPEQPYRPIILSADTVMPGDTDPGIQVNAKVELSLIRFEELNSTYIEMAHMPLEEAGYTDPHRAYQATRIRLRDMVNEHFEVIFVSSDARGKADVINLPEPEARGMAAVDRLPNVGSHPVNVAIVVYATQADTQLGIDLNEGITVVSMHLEPPIPPNRR